MAYTCVRVTFEIGHEASLRAKKTADGFTHDWEIFVRGAENTDIQYFVDKVIFHLHDTFQNPKRVIKTPPYSVRESGYAGFLLPIEIYFKNKEEPFRIRFKYHLTLQESGPPFSTVTKEKYVFKNPSEDFRRKLIRGGGVGVGEPIINDNLALNADHTMDDHKNFVNNKNKSSPQDGSAAKKSKKENITKNDEQLSANDPFSIFGQPIKTSKIPFVSKPTKPISDSKALPQPEKQAHSSKSSKHSSSSHKDKEKERSAEKDKDKAKEKDKDRDKNAIKKTKEDVKKEKNKEDKVKTLKSSKEDSKKNTAYHEDKPKGKPMEKPTERAEKEIKVDKKDKEKKRKDEKKSKTKEKHKNSEKKENIEVKEGYDRVEQTFKDDFREEKKSFKISAAEEKDDKPDRLAKEKQSEPKNLLSNASVNNLDGSVVNNGDSLRREEKHKHHKHKKDKSKKDSKREKEERKEKKEAKENKEKRSPVLAEVPRSTPKSDSPKRIKKPLKRLFEELSDKSDSELSSLNDEPHERLIMKERESPEINVKVEPVTLIKQEEQTKEEKEICKKRKKNNEERENKKRKRKSKDKEECAAVKIVKYENAVSENAVKPMEIELAEQRPASMSPASETKFTDEYITKLKELQRKIMTLEDNSGLQRIVQVVAETVVVESIREILEGTDKFDMYKFN